MAKFKINWPAYFKPVCVLTLLCGALWLVLSSGVPADNLIGKIAVIAGGVLFLGAGLFGLLGKPRSLVPLLDFFALAAAMVTLLKVGFGWWEVLGIVCAVLYLICCNAHTQIEGIDEEKFNDYSELHPYWENMENWKKQYKEDQKQAEKSPEDASPEESSR